MLASNPALQAEYRRLQADVRLAKDLVPLVEATTATQGELPAYARGRLQTKVRQTLGGPAAKANDSAEPVRALLLRWRWWLGLAVAAAAVAFLAIPAFLGHGRPVIEVAMLDLAGATRGADDKSLSLLRETWGGIAVEQLASDADLRAWETKWPTEPKRLLIKVVYDRSAGELRILGHGPGGVFTNSFPVEPDLGSALTKAKAYLDGQISSGPSH